jgi:hypothetical protein
MTFTVLLYMLIPLRFLPTYADQYIMMLRDAYRTGHVDLTSAWLNRDCLKSYKTVCFRNK